MRRKGVRIGGFGFTLFLLTVLNLFSFTSNAALVSNLGYSSVDGSFQVDLHEGATRHLEFHALRDPDGRVTGETTFKDNLASSKFVESSNEVDSGPSQPLFFKAVFDCLVIDRNKAVMSGEITESSSRSYIGRRIVVVTQENGGAEDPSKTDRLTWGVYRSDKKTWLVSDSERSADEISPLSWIASDSERLDDEGVPSDKEQRIGCQSFPLSAFSFINPKQGHGSVHIRP